MPLKDYKRKQSLINNQNHVLMSGKSFNLPKTLKSAKFKPSGLTDVNGKKKLKYG